ncbi:MAG: two-component system response regulator, partial [Bacilli bacterium]|nr:two-component system response regulator [Bacilli bacterium]
DIPISARIMAVADVYDALVSKRPYKDPFPVSMAAAIIKEGSGIQFDPLVVQAFFAALETITKVTNAEANEVVSLAKEKLSN